MERLRNPLPTKKKVKAERLCREREKFNPDFWMFREFAHYAAKVAEQREVIDWITCGFYAKKKGE